MVPGAEVSSAYVSDCYFCLGNRRVSGISNPTYASTFVFDNDLPCVGPDAPGELAAPAGIYRNRPARGIASLQNPLPTDGDYP